MKDQNAVNFQGRNLSHFKRNSCNQEFCTIQISQQVQVGDKDSPRWLTESCFV